MLPGRVALSSKRGNVNVNLVGKVRMMAAPSLGDGARFIALPGNRANPAEGRVSDEKADGRFPAARIPSSDGQHNDSAGRYLDLGIIDPEVVRRMRARFTAGFRNVSRAVYKRTIRKPKTDDDCRVGVAVRQAPTAC